MNAVIITFFDSSPLHLRVAFLPWTRITLKGPKSRQIIVDPKILGQHLKNRRLELGLLQREAAAAIGVDEGTFQSWEQGRAEPGPKAWRAILLFLGYDPKDEPETLGGHLKRWRRALGLTQVQAASRLGVSPDSYQGWESDSYQPSPAMRVRLTRLVGS